MALDEHRYYGELRAEAGKLADSVLAGDPAQPVPACPGWTVADLSAHVGRGHRWAAHIIEQRATQPVFPADADDPPPASPAEHPAWLLAGARRLADAVRESGPDAHVWTWSSNQSAGFWLRRLTHDTIIHRIDAGLARGCPPELAPDVAADGIADLLTAIATLSAPGHPDPVFAGLRGDGETLQLHATDPGLGSAGQWLVHRMPAGVRWEHGHRKADSVMRGTALDLLLVMNRRAAPSRIELLGDESLIAYWLKHSAF